MKGLNRAFCSAAIFDGEKWHDNAALLVADGLVKGIVASCDAPPAFERLDLGDGLLAPGFVDLQVNGGGGVLFNNDPSPDAIGTIVKAHRRFGTTALLPTLITDSREAMVAAIEAIRAAKEAGLAGCLGLHLEGPFLAPSRKGAHLAELMGPMTDDDMAMLIGSGVRPLLLTVAAEVVTPEQIAKLRANGIHVSIGHSDAGFDQAKKAADAGATLVTHLFNAMSPLNHRELGLVGAALADGRLHAGLIADGVHVHPDAIRIALRAKTGPGRIFLVTDAMATVGSDILSFELHGRTIHRGEGRLTLADGTLAGVDMDMASMLRFMHEKIGVPVVEALRMATLYPAEAIGVAPLHGVLKPGARADFVHLGAGLQPLATFMAGVNSPE
jgi:N-acetylglucosamine-6-phosphate deacetylase